MRIATNKVVTIEYTVTTDEGVLVDSSSAEPMSYMHGVGGMISGLETALEGKGVGERVSAIVPPDQAYGERDDSLMRAVPKSRFDPAVELKPGMRFEVASASGKHVVTVVGIEGENVIVDGNHPLAGIPLHFDVNVVEIRNANPDEMQHGHVHGPNCGHD
jgi:FKBP-type peptidyl-prolyl cis-trans isomerase SlyD